MTGTEILAMAGLHCEDETVDNAGGLKWINECIQLDLAVDAKLVGSSDITVIADAWSDLPSGVIEIIEIYEKGKNYPHYGKKQGRFYSGIFDVRDGQIMFPNSGTFTVYYYKVPPIMTSLSEDIPINDAFGYPISMWVARRHKYFDDEDSEAAVRMSQEYQYLKEQAIRVISRTKPTTKAPARVKVGLWT